MTDVFLQLQMPEIKEKFVFGFFGKKFGISRIFAKK